MRFKAPVQRAGDTFVVGDRVRFRKEVCDPDLHRHVMDLMFTVVGVFADMVRIESVYQDGTPCCLGVKPSHLEKVRVPKWKLG